MKGYKIFERDWTCRGYQYQVGKIARHTGDIELCRSGFHFCQRALDCIEFYLLDPTFRYAEVRATGRIKTDTVKTVTDQIEIVREIPFEEFRDMCQGTFKLYFPNGDLAVTNDVYQGLTHGWRTEWYGNRGLKARTEFVRDQRHGHYTRWYRNGQQHIQAWYREDRVVGRYIEWFDNGQIKLDVTY